MSNREKTPARKGAKPARSNPAGKKNQGLTAEERAAMKEHLKDLKTGTEGEGVVLAKIAAMAEPDRALARRVHEIVKASAPALSPRTWYGMPAYANALGKVVCFFQDAQKFKARYATLGFSDTARLDDGDMWPTAFALKEWSPVIETRIAALVKKAVS